MLQLFSYDESQMNSDLIHADELMDYFEQLGNQT